MNSTRPSVGAFQGQRPVPLPAARLAAVTLALLTLGAVWASAATFTSDTTIRAGDTTYDGQDIVVIACTVTVHGAHAFTSLTATNAATVVLGGGSVLTVSNALEVLGTSTVLCQGTNTDAQVGGVWAGVGVEIHAGNVTVAADSKISADGQGYAGGGVETDGAGPGGGKARVGWYGGAGGGYGGRGGMYWAELPGQPYGSATMPLDLGSGGGGNSAGTSGNGGGAIRLVVADTLTLHGIISANGVPGSFYGWSGSGGSVYVTTDTLTGNGAFLANGADRAGDAGGGGRIAVYYNHADGFTGFAASTAKASPGTGGAQDGTVGFCRHEHRPPAAEFVRAVRVRPGQ